MAGTLTEEPRPRDPPEAWAEYDFAVQGVATPLPPLALPGTPFTAVLEGRRSRLGQAVGWERLASLLWYGAGTRGAAPQGRAGVPIEWRTSPAAGGLHGIHIVCLCPSAGEAVRLYQPRSHTFALLDCDPLAVQLGNQQLLSGVIGSREGATLRFVADTFKYAAAYEHPDSLILRDAGCLVAVLAMCAEALGLACCPLGFLGQDLVGALRWPGDRFRAVGGVQVGERRRDSRAEAPE